MDVKNFLFGGGDDADEVEVESNGEKPAKKAPAGTFFDNAAGAAESQSTVKHSKVEESAHVFGYNPDLELQTQIGGDSRSYLQASINARQEDAQPTSRARIEHAMKPRTTVYRDGLHQLSTHRAARGEGVISAAERESLIERAERKAWDSFARMLELFAR